MADEAKKKEKMKKEKPEKARKTAKTGTKKQAKNPKELHGALKIMCIIGAALICVALTFLAFHVQYGEKRIQFNAMLTSFILENVVAFAFLGALIMIGIRALILKFATWRYQKNS